MKYELPRTRLAGDYLDKPVIGTDLPSLLDYITHPSVPVSAKLWIYKNVHAGDPTSFFKKKYVAGVGGNYLEGDDADLLIHEVAQLYVRNVRIQMEQK